MRRFDRWLQDMRIAQAEPFVRPGDRLLDVGCLDGVLLRRLESRVSRAVGIDPLVERPTREGKVEILRATIPGDHPFGPGEFDCITMLAVLEHIKETAALARECHRLLAPGGRVVITVPRPAVDHIIAVLRTLRVMDGSSLEEHHGYDVNQTPAIFGGAGFSLHTRRSFELGLNLLFVFEKANAGVIDREVKPRTPAGVGA
jgi:SAM-dependent methyltransferase